MRKIIYNLVEPPSDGEKADFYDILMMLAIIASIIPLMFKSTNSLFFVIDKITVFLFILDYLFRWLTADFKLEKHDITAFIAYPFTLMAIIDLLSILPGIFAINQSLRLFKIIRLIRMFRIFRVFKAMRYSKNIELIIHVISTQKNSLISVCYISIIYIFVSALVVFNVEPETFKTFFDAIYWATVSLTTVGYGDIYPVTVIGRIVTMISSVFGIAIIAMPAGIITAGLMDELNK